MSSDPMSTSTRNESAALALAPTEAERRVQRAKERLTAHLTALDLRARQLARQSAWVAGMVLLGVVGAAAASSVFGRMRRRSVYVGDERRTRRGVGTALVLAAFGLLTRRMRAF